MCPTPRSLSFGKHHATKACAAIFPPRYKNVPRTRSSISLPRIVHVFVSSQPLNYCWSHEDRNGVGRWTVRPRHSGQVRGKIPACRGKPRHLNYLSSTSPSRATMLELLADRSGLLFPEHRFSNGSYATSQDLRKLELHFSEMKRYSSPTHGRPRG